MRNKDINQPYAKPIRIGWKVVAGNRKLSILEEQDLILCDYDYQIRKMDPKTQDFIPAKV